MKFLGSITLLATWSILAECCKSFTIQPKTWMYKGHPIAYEESKRIPVIESNKDSVPVLILNGFGVGSFHQHRLIPQILNNENAEDRMVYGIDYLGQGKSWPIDCDDGNSKNEKGLIYSADTWVDQIICFIEEVVVSNQNNKVHLVGNSVGGYLSVMIALKRPDLVDTITLLNATPVWGLNLPFWDGRLPAPFIPKKIGRYLFDRIRDLNTIDKYLEAAYSDPRAYDDVLISQIRSCTENNGGHAAFASILYSPPCSVSNDKEKKKTSFTEKIERLKCDVLLIFGKDDPWCKSAFAKSMMLSLNSREHNYVQRYVELSNCGHCPNHEAPQAVAKILNNWLSKNDRKSEQLNLIFGSGQTSKDQNQHHSITEPWGTEILMREVLEEEVNNLSLLDKISTKLVG